MRYLVFIIITTGISLSSLSLLGQESKDLALSDTIISFKYTKGEYLLFDCQDKHWVCSAEIEYNKCKLSRERSKLDKDKNLKCAAFKKFDTEQECHLSQQKIVNRGSFDHLCTP